MGGLRFGRFELRVAERLLLADGVPQHLGDRALDLLCVLVNQHGRVVDKDELLEQVWPGRLMAENNLTVQVSALRKVLGREAVRTVAGRGYQFAWPVEAPMALPPELGAAAGQTRQPLPQPAPDAGSAQSLRRLPALARSAVERSDIPGDSPLLACVLLDPPSGGGPPSAALTTLFDGALHSLVQAHGGTLGSAGRPPRRLASFYSLRDALACCRQIQTTFAHQVTGLAPARRPQLKLALHRIEGDARQAADLAGRLAALAAPGQILASAEVAGRFIPALDGDLQDLGERQLGLMWAPQRVYALMPATGEAAPGRLILRLDDLRPTVAVLPPRGFGGSPEAGADALGDILADQLISALSRSHVIHVTSRLSTQALSGRALSAEQVGGLLGAQFVVSGHCVAMGGRVRVHLEVADGRSGRVLGTSQAEDADRAVLQTDGPLVQSLIADLGRTVLRHELSAAGTVPLPALETHTLLLAGIGLMFRLAPGDFAQARRLLDEVCRRAPRHAAPLAWLARWHLFRLVQGTTTDRAADGRAALQLAQRALDLDPDSSLALTMLANAHINWLRDLDRAEQLCAAALAINPSESLAWLQRGNARSFAGDGAEALACAQRAVHLSPLDPARHYYLSLLASAALTAADHARAIHAARQALKLNRSHVSTHRVLAIALQLSGRSEEARVAVGDLLRLDPQLTVAGYVAQSPGARSGLAEVYGRALAEAGVPAC